MAGTPYGEWSKVDKSEQHKITVVIVFEVHLYMKYYYNIVTEAP